jgi:hypothetical protein
MPSLAALARIWQVRTRMLAGSASSFGLGYDYAVVLLSTTVLVLIGARLYPQLAT